MFSTRSAALLSDAAITACAALLRSDSATWAFCSAASCSSSRLMRWPASASSSATVIAAITVSRVSPISPNLLRSPLIRLSSSRARFIKWPSWPSSQAIRNWRPLLVTLTWNIFFDCRLLPQIAPELNPGLPSRGTPRRHEWFRSPDRFVAQPRDWHFPARERGRLPHPVRWRAVRDRCPARERVRRALLRHGRLRAAVQPPPPKLPAPAIGAAPRLRSDRYRSSLSAPAKPSHDL